MCVPLFPVCRTPSWQLAHVSVMPSWVNRAGFHAVVEWQSPHSPVVGMWLVGLPVDLTPSWQVEQGWLMAEWSKLAGFQAVVAWQLPHSAVVTM